MAQDLQPQLDAVKRQIIADEYKESEIVVVKGKESAIKLKEEQRQTLNEMKQLIDEYPSIEAVYFFAVDRLARRMSVVMSIKEWADERKINLVFLNPQPMYTFKRNEEGELVKNELTDLLLAMLSYGAMMERRLGGVPLTLPAWQPLQRRRRPDRRLGQPPLDSVSHPDRRIL